MKVLIADQFETSGLEGLAAAGCEVVFDPALKDDELVSALRETRAEVLIVRSTKVTAAMMDAGDLALIVRAGAGYNTIDVAGRVGSRDLRLELPGQELDRGRGAGVRPHPRAGPSDPGQRRGAARRTLEQEGVLEGEGPARPDARAARFREYRPGTGAAGTGLRHGYRHLVAPLRGRRPRSSPDLRLYGLDPASRDSRVTHPPDAA